MLKLIIKEESKQQTVETFETFEELKQHLIENDYFSWIKDNEPGRSLPDATNGTPVDEVQKVLSAYDYCLGNDESNKALPDFTNVTSVAEIQQILSTYDYSWWSVEVIPVETIE